MNKKTGSANSSYSRLAAASGILTALAGLSILIGWQFDIITLESFGISPVPMKPNPALAFFFAGLSLILLNLKNKSKTTKFIANTSAAVVFSIGLLTVIEYIFNIDFHIDQLLFLEVPGAVLTIIPGRMSLNLAIGLTTAGIALLSIRRQNDFARGLSILAAGLGALAVLSYILSLSVLLEMLGVNTIALNSAICLIILSAGIYFTIPEREFGRSKIEKQSLAAFIAIALILIASNILFILLQNKVVKLDKQVTDINKVIDKIDNSLFWVARIESDSRGYVITTDDEYLQLFNKSKSNIYLALDDLKTSDAEYSVKQYLDTLYLMLAESISYYEETISIRKDQGFQAAAERVAGKKGKLLIDNIRETAGRMKSLEYESYNKTHDQELAVNKEANSLQTIFMFVLFGFLIVIYFIISSDITARTKAEKSLMESEEKFRSISQSAADAIITADRNGIIIGWNKGAEKIFGYKEEEIKGEELIKIIPQRFIEQHVEGMNRVERGGEHHLIGKSVELLGLHKNGNEFPIEVSLSEWNSSSGKYFSGIIRDITERKQIELERQVIYEITDGITTTSNLDELLKLMHTSLSKRLFAENCYVALYNPDTDLFSFPYFVDKFDPTPPPVALKKSCTAYIFRTQKPMLITPEIFEQLKERNEVELVGSPSPSWLGVPLQTPDGIIGVLVIQHYEKENIYTERDIEFLESIGSEIAIAIERKLTEEEIKSQNEKLSKLNAEKDKLFSIIAHDLRSPFSGLMNLTEMMGNEGESFTIPEYLEFSKSLNESARNIYKLINNLFEWAQLQKGSIQFSPRMLSLQKIVSQVIESMVLHAKKKNIEIINTVPEPVQVYADENMTNSVIRNLVSNSVKFTETGGNVTINANPTDNGTIEISVSDTGIGMSEDQIKKLFTIGEKTGSLGTAGELSTGLGLLLCKEFVEKHNGKIHVKSELGKGSIFTITIPTCKNEHLI